MALRLGSSKAIFRRKAASQIAGQAILGLCILAAAFLIARGRAAARAPEIITPVVREFDSVQILVPTEPVAAGTRVRDLKLNRLSYPKHQVPGNSLSNLDGLDDYVVVTALPANLPLFKENLSQIGHIANPVQEKIPLGMRAMTIRVDATSAVEGWAGSGSVVDILLIEKDRTTVVAEKVKILSAERSVAPVEGQSAPTVPSTVTLLVTQEQCLSINTAIPLGKIAFALRSSRDEESWQDTEFRSNELLSRENTTNDSQGSVKGVISIKDNDKDRSFALSDGRWVKTETVPQGFFINSRDSQ